ncbi:transposase family protein [Staphylococcus agnetis]|nr:transposase family protein [Staphylococcus agnetis]
MDLILERPTYLILKKQRFYCKECWQILIAITPFIKIRCTISNDVKLVIVSKALHTSVQMIISFRNCLIKL